MNYSELYPQLTAIGLVPKRDFDPKAPPGIDGKQLRTALERQHLLKAWQRWAGNGLTMAANGVYPWDVERFLEGKPNVD